MDKVGAVYFSLFASIVYSDLYQAPQNKWE